MTPPERMAEEAVEPRQDGAMVAAGGEGGGGPAGAIGSRRNSQPWSSDETLPRHGGAVSGYGGGRRAFHPSHDNVVQLIAPLECRYRIEIEMAFVSCVAGIACLRSHCVVDDSAPDKAIRDAVWICQVAVKANLYTAPLLYKMSFLSEGNRVA